jgi:hypothetical protein
MSLQDSSAQPAGEERTIYVTLTLAMQVLLGLGLAFFVLQRNWENVFLAAIVIALTQSP